MPFLRALDCYVPERREEIAALCRDNPEWVADAILKKTGIRTRAIAEPDQTAADLGCLAAERLLESSGIDRQSLDGLIFNSHSPDYWMPATACLLQQRLGLPSHCAAFDLGLGCSGFPYSLWVADALVQSGARRNVLVISAETFSRFCNRHDLSTVTLFGDGAGAAVVSHDPEEALAEIRGSIVGTDGSGAEFLIVEEGAARAAANGNPVAPGRGPTVSMNGPEVFSFALATVRPALNQLLKQEGLTADDVACFIMHQASGFMLDKLQHQLGLSAERMPIDLEELGNTANASVPILLQRLRQQQRFRAGDDLILAGFGVGWSWALMHLIWLEKRAG